MRRLSLLVNDRLTFVVTVCVSLNPGQDRIRLCGVEREGGELVTSRAGHDVAVTKGLLEYLAASLMRRSPSSCPKASFTAFKPLMSAKMTALGKAVAQCHLQTPFGMQVEPPPVQQAGHDIGYRYPVEFLLDTIASEHRVSMGLASFGKLLRLGHDHVLQ